MSLLLVLELLSSSSRATEDLPACTLEVPVYHARGDRLPFRIIAVTPDEQNSVDLLTINKPEYRVVAVGEKLYFQPTLIGKRKLKLVLDDGKSHKITTQVALMHCQQRMSIEYGGINSLGTGEVAWSTASGRLTGCKLVGDWWVRVLPMFGALDNPIIHEGFVRLSDGSFWIASSMHGERHIIVIGHDKEPVKVFAFDVVEGGKNDIGNVDISGSCPK